jgi:hypothetical protein
MLRQAELDAAREAALSLMPDEAEVQRYNPMSDEWETVGTYVCRVEPKRAVTKSGDLLLGVVLWNVLLPYDADVEANDRIAVGSATYSVTGTDAGRSEPVALVALSGRIG